MDANTREYILCASRELLQKMIEANGIEKEAVACAIFTTTPDLNAAFPATAARQLGWTQVALLGGQEIEAEDGLPKCLRILILFNTEKRPEQIVHVYLKGTEVLRQGNNQ